MEEWECRGACVVRAACTQRRHTRVGARCTCVRGVQVMGRWLNADGTGQTHNDRQVRWSHAHNRASSHAHGHALPKRSNPM